VYNAEAYLSKAIQSVLSQTFDAFELLIVDDGSTDRSSEIANSFADPRIRIIRNENNKGQAFAQNQGVKAAQGEYVAILGADDEALPDRLATEVYYLDAHDDICMVGTAYYLMDSWGRLIGHVHVVTEPIVVRWRLLFGNPIGAPTVMIRREVFEKVGGFDETIICSEDMEMWGRVCAYGKIGQIDQPLTKYRVHQSSLSRRQSPVLKMHWQTKISRRNLALLAGINVSDRVIESLTGMAQETSKESAEEAYQAVYDSARIFQLALIRMKRESRLIFAAMLHDLLRLARQNDACRLRALEVALRFGLHYTPESLLTPQFARFAARVALPAGMRRWLAGLRPGGKSNA
jgi:glycosyltransferase involved in cell wall biosynthesis